MQNRTRANPIFIFSKVARGCAESNPREAVERKCEACLGDSSNTSSIPSLLVEQLSTTSIRGSDVPLVPSFLVRCLQICSFRLSIWQSVMSYKYFIQHICFSCARSNIDPDRKYICNKNDPKTMLKRCLKDINTNVLYRSFLDHFLSDPKRLKHLIQKYLNLT